MKWKLLLLCCLLSIAVAAQNLINLTPFSVPKPTPANTASWASLPSLMVVANYTGSGDLPAKLVESKVAFTIKSNGNKVCGGRLQSAGFSGRTRVYKASEISALLEGCVLKPGSYQLCVQFFADSNGRSLPISGEKCTAAEFIIEGGTDGPAGTITYTPPQNISPAIGKVFTEAEAKQPINFRWTPLLPKPRVALTYRLKVWEVKEGQNATQVIKTEQPVLTQDVKDQTQYSSKQDWEIGVRAPLIWKVEALDKEGKLLGVSEVTGFSVSSGGAHAVYDAKIISVECIDYNHVKICGNFICRESGYGPDPGYTIFPTQITTVNLIAIPSNINIGSVSNAGTVSQGNSFPVCITSAAIPAGTTSLSLVFSGKVLDPQHFIVGPADAETTMPDCTCKPCNQNKVMASNQNMQNVDVNAGTVSIMNSVSALPNNITKIQADIVYIKVVPKNADCGKCDKQPAQQGNFLGLNRIVVNPALWANSGNAGFSQNSVNNIARSVTFTSANASGVAMGTAISIRHTIGIPPVGCCGDEVEVWIRYTVWDDKCRVCSDNLVKSILTRAGTCVSGATAINNTSGQNGKKN
jgi:hypothetical protein